MNDELLSVDLSTVDTSRTLLAGGEYDFTCQKMELGDNSQGTGRKLSIWLKITQPGVSSKGTPVGAGFTLFISMGITPTAKMSQEAILQKLARIRQSFGFKSGSFGDVNQYIGRICRAKVKIGKDMDGEPSNEIAAWLPTAA